MTIVVGGTDAGSSLIPYYRVAERAFPILPDDVIIQGDTESHTWGIAWYRGLDPVTGFPIFAGRDDLVASPLLEKTPYVGFHEAGHAFMTMCARGIARLRGTADGHNEVRERYWAMRGFPGTWWDAHTFANSPGGGWRYYPDESFADAFAQVIFGYVDGEWTENYGLPIAVDAARAFFKLLERVALGGDDMDEATTRRLIDARIDDRLATFAQLQRETGHEPIRDAFNDHTHYDVQKTRPITGPPIVTLGNEGR